MRVVTAAVPRYAGTQVWLSSPSVLRSTRDWFAITGKPRSYGYSLLRVPSPTGTHSYGNTVPVVEMFRCRRSVLDLVGLGQ